MGLRGGSRVGDRVGVGAPPSSPSALPGDDICCLLGLSACFLQAVKEPLRSAITWTVTRAAWWLLAVNHCSGLPCEQDVFDEP